VFHLIIYLRNEQNISPSGQKRFGVSEPPRRFQNGAAMTAQVKKMICAMNVLVFFASIIIEEKVTSQKNGQDLRSR